MSTRELGSRRARIVVAGLTTAVMGAAGLTGTSGAASAAEEPCFTAYPQESLSLGQDLEGLTVSQGTAPEGFTGDYVGTLQDGIAPGVDMILAELHSTAVDRNGVWAGMSGSPVYADAEHTQLVGAVSYSLSEGGSSTLAGITPAAAMADLVPAAPAPVAIPRPVLRRIVARGAATTAEATSGLRRLPTPISVSGLSQSRFDQLAGWLDRNGPVVRATGGAATASADVNDIVPGGNVAASLGYGYVAAAAVGTVTAVCGTDVIAFGHPFNYAGPSTYSLHPAEAVTVVPGGGFGSSFKVANLGDPVGTVDDDRLAGIHGLLGASPQAFDVTSTATYGSRTVTGTTHVTVTDLVTDAGLANAFAVSDRALDRAGKGSAIASWSIAGKRRNGAPFDLAGSNVYSSSYDVASAPLGDLAMQLYTLLENETEQVTITGITTNTTFLDDAASWRIGRTYWRSKGSWKRITGRAPAVARARRTTNIRVELFSRDADTTYITIPVLPSRKSVRRSGVLVLNGGFSGDEEFGFFDSSEEFLDEYGEGMVGGDIPASIPEVLRSLRGGQANDTIASTFSVRGTATKRRTIDLGRVVSGSVAVPIVVRR